MNKSRGSGSRKIYNGNAFYFVLFLLFLGWLLLTLKFQLVTIEKAKGITKDNEGAGWDYFNYAAEQYTLNEYFIQQTSGFLELFEKYCEPEDSEQVDIENAAALKARREAVCRVLFEAGEMVASHYHRLGEGGANRNVLFRFNLVGSEMEGEKEISLGPFFSRAECSVIAARLVQHGEQATACLPYEPWQHELFFATLVD
ncbi:MAG: hypothetical protein JJU25_17095 [Halomonas sp.]|nr:hypothetical protein [Halomonas sp.]MCC5884335.1 hypothetical protein [Halomonas sp.]